MSHFGSVSEPGVTWLANLSEANSNKLEFFFDVITNLI